MAAQAPSPPAKTSERRCTGPCRVAHPAIAAAMTHVDSSTEPRLERIMSEIRTHRKRVAAELEPESSDAPPGVSALG